MPTSIEQLTTRLEEAKTQVEESEGLSEIKRIEKTKELEKAIDTIRSDLDLLKKEATPEELQNILILEGELKNLDINFKSEFSTELAEIKKSQQELKEEIEEQNQSSSEKPDVKEEEKGWIKTQRDKIPEGGKTALKVAGGIVGGVLVWKGIKKLFGRGKEKKEGKDESFWDHGLGQGLKYVGLSIAGAFGGRWLYNNWDTVKSRFDFESPQKKKEKHEKFMEYRTEHKNEFDSGIEYNKYGKYKFEYRKQPKSFNDLVVFDTNGNLDETKTKENINKWKVEIDEKLFEKTSLKEAAEILEKNPSLNELGNKVNNFHGAMGLVDLSLGEADFEDGKPGLLLAQLSNMAGSVGDLLEKGSYENLIEQVETGYFQQIIDWALSISSQAGASALIRVASLISEVKLPLSEKDIMGGTKDQIKEWAEKLVQSNESEFEKHAQSIFIKRMQIVTYLQAVKEKYMYNLIKNKLAEDDSFANKSQEDQEELITEKMEDENFLKANKISDKLSKFNSLSLIDLANTQDESILDSLDTPYINDDLLDSLEDIDTEESELLSNLDEAETDEEIKEVAGKLLSDINGLGYNTWYAGFQTLYNSYFQIDVDKMHEMAEEQYASLMQGTLDKINIITNKTTLTNQDKEELNNLIKGYTKTKKSMLLAGQYKAENTDEGLMIQYALPFWEGTKKQYFYTKAQVEKGNVGGVLLSAMVLDLSSYPLRGAASIFINPKLGKVLRFSPTVKLTEFVLNKTFVGRPILNLTSRVASYMKGFEFYKNFGKNASTVLAHDYINGKIGYQRMVRVLKQFEGVKIAEERQVFNELFNTNEATSKQLLKINKLNPKLTKFMFDQEKLGGLLGNKINSIYDLAKKGRINFKITDNLEFVDDIIKQSEKDTKIGVKILSRLKNYKDFTKFKELAQSNIKIKFVDDIPYFDDIVRAIAKNIRKIESVEDINKILTHINTNGAHIPDKGAFFSNAMKNIKTLKKSNWNFGIEDIKKLNLNEVPQKLKFTRLQDSLKGAKEALEKAKRTLPKAKIPLLNKQLKQINILRNARFESFQALDFGLGKTTVFSTLNANPTLLNKLSNLDQTILKDIAKLDNVDDIKALLKSNGIDGVSDDVLESLSKLKKTDNIKNFFSYAKNYPKYQAGLGKIKGVLKSPGMKYVGKMFEKVFGGLAIGFSVYHGVDTYGEGSDLILSGQNIQRGKMKQEAGIAMGAVGALAGALMFVPGVGWVVGAVVGASEILVGAYYETVDKYLQNFNDLITKTDLYIKETIVSIISGIRNNDRSWKNNLGRLVQDVKSVYPVPMANDPLSSLMSLVDRVDFNIEGPRVLKASMEALIHLDELKKHPYASINLGQNDLSDELKEMGITETVIAEEKTKVNNNRADRLNYFRGNYESISTLISDKDLESGIVMSKITDIINETDMFIQVENIATKQDLENHMKSVEKKLKKEPYKLFETLTDKQLLYYYHHRNSLLDSSDTINENIKVFEEYMQYKSFKGELDIFDTANTGIYEKDNTELITFFTEFKIQPKVFSDQEVESAYLDMTLDKYEDVESMFNVSNNAIQNSLYLIIKDVIGFASIKNNREQIQKFLSEDTNEFAEEHYGLYFDDGGDLNINGSSWLGRDDEFVWDSDMGKLIKEIDRQFGAGDAADQGSGDKYINKELGQKYIRILKQEKEISENKDKYTKQIVSHIKQYGGESGYVRLPLNDIELGIKIGITDISKHLYKVDDGKIVTYKPGGELMGESI